MSKFIEVMAIVEGKTEKIFINRILQPYLVQKQIKINVTNLNGNIRFARAKNDIKAGLKQSQDTYITLFLDYYGITEWPEYKISKSKTTHIQKVKHLCDATRTALKEEIERTNPNHNFDERRFIPYFSMFEFEALLFSEPNILASEIGLKNSDPITEILNEFNNEPEQINDSLITAPSKRLITLSNRFNKHITGINIAEKIGIPKIRQQCPLFNQWLTTLEDLKPLNA